MSGTFPQYERGAPYWVWFLCCLGTTLLIAATVGAGFLALGAVAGGAPPAALLMVPLAAVFPVLMGRLTRAWRQRRAWAWWVLTVLSAVGCAFGLLQVLLAGPDVRGVLGLAVNTLFLVLLSQPSSRAWTRSPARERTPSAVS